VRAAGVDPGGRPPVRERAVTTAARLIEERGLGAVTLEAVAAAAGCSLPSLHTVFGGRDGLLTAIFDRYAPVRDLEALATSPPERVEDTVRGIYRAILAAFARRPRVLPALLGDLFSRPDGPASRMLAVNLPRLLASADALLEPHVRAGRLRPLPHPLLVQLMVAPLVLHMLLRPALEPRLGPDLPSADAAGEVFTGAFLRGAGLPIEPEV
jgi:AcrR family transcriptional regulator